MPPDRALAAGWRLAPMAAAVALLLGLLAVVLYGAVLDAPFLYDDVVVQHDRRLHATTLTQVAGVLAERGLPRRVGHASFALNHLAGGLDPRGYRLTNVLLHVANGTMVFVLGFLLWRRVEPSAPRPWLVPLLGALLWFVHPVQTQAVSYVYQRFTCLAAFFYLAALLASIAARDGTRARRLGFVAATLVLGLLALGTKENAGTLPVFVLLVHLLFLREERALDRRTVAAIAVTVVVLAAICAVYLGPRFVSMIAADAAHRGYTPLQRVMTEWRVVVYYVGLLAWPHPSRLHLDYDWPLSTGLLAPPSTLLCLVLLGGAVGAALVSLRRHPLPAFAVLWFLGQLTIESSFIPLDLVYEHRLYLPSVIPFLALAAAASRIPDVRLTLATAAAAVVILGTWSVRRNHVWADPVALFQDNALKAPGKGRVHANLALALLERRDREGAAAAFRRAVAEDPALRGARTNLAALLMDQPQHLAEAESLLREETRRFPEYVAPLLNLGVVLKRTQRFAEAERVLLRALELEPSNAVAAFNLAGLYANSGDVSRALAVVERVLTLQPTDARLLSLRQTLRASRPSY